MVGSQDRRRSTDQDRIGHEPLQPGCGFEDRSETRIGRLDVWHDDNISDVIIWFGYHTAARAMAGFDTGASVGS